MFDFIHAMPIWMAKAAAIALFTGILAVTWSLPSEFIFRGAPDMSRWRDLRIWATLLVILQIILYAMF